MSRVSFTAALLLMAAFAVSCKTAPIYNAINVPIVSPEPLPLEVIRERIGRAARIQEWDVEDIEPGILIATKHVKSHIGTATITFDTKSFSITLRHSTNLKQRVGTIHKAYNRWVAALELSIRQEIASTH